jgi:hypothetical protein
MIDASNRASALAARVAAIGTQLDKLYGERRALALSAADGDKVALKQIETIDTAAAKLLAEQVTLIAAVEQAEEIDRERLAEREQADRQHHEAAARKTADAVLKVNADVDTALLALTKLFEKRAALIRDLTKTGCLPPNLGQRFLAKGGPTGAAKKAGLDKHIALEFTANAHATTLTEANGFLRGPLTLPKHESPPPSPQPQPRFRLGEASQ